MTGLVDSHFHLDRFEPAERAEVLARAAAAGVVEAVTIGTRLSRSDEVVGLARAGGAIPLHCAIGTHPDYAHEEAIPDPHALAERARAAPEVVAIGESGLDFVVADSPREVQERSFRAHLRAARAAGLPLVIHARGADDAVADVLRSEWETGGPFGFVLHCFASGAALAETGLALGGYLSFSGILTFPKADALRAIAQAVPHDRLLVETDAPFLAPVPHRGRRNEPAFVAHPASRLAAVVGRFDPRHVVRHSPSSPPRISTACSRRRRRAPLDRNRGSRLRRFGGRAGARRRRRARRLGDVR